MYVNGSIAADRYSSITRCGPVIFFTSAGDNITATEAEQEKGERDQENGSDLFLILLVVVCREALIFLTKRGYDDEMMSPRSGPLGRGDKGTTLHPDVIFVVGSAREYVSRFSCGVER